MSAPVVTVDGPSGVGKGTLCIQLAERLGWHLLDSGAIYRLLGLAAGRSGIEAHDIPALTDLAGSLEVSFKHVPGDELVRAYLGDEDVSAAIRTEDAGRMASLVAPDPGVRAALLARQRAFAVAPGLIADGRDMGTVVFPDAPLKIFLTASALARAQRRYKQLIGKGLSANLADLSADIADRDRRDSERATAPLRPAPDAIEVDTTEVDSSAVLDRVMDALRSRRLIVNDKCAGNDRAD